MCFVFSSLIFCFVTAWGALSGCGPEQAPHFKRADLLGGETTIVLHCLEEYRAAVPRTTTPFRAAGCPRSSLVDLAIDPPPSELTLSAECNHRILHVTSENFQLNEVTQLGPHGEFQLELAMNAHYRSLSTDTPSPEGCQAKFKVLLTGQIQCKNTDTSAAVKNAEIRADWIETSAGSVLGCPSTFPCRFRSQSYLNCAAS